MSSTTERPAPAASKTRRRGRRSSDYIVPVWLGLAAMVALAHPGIPGAPWLMVHLVVLGALTHSALVWSEHFAQALLRTPGPDAAALRNRWVLAGGASLVLLGLPVGWWWVALAGATVVSGSVLWHAFRLVRDVRRALPGRFRATLHYYVAAACCLPVGATFGITLGRGLDETWHARFLVAHTMTMLLGWVGLTVLGTLVTFWPTVLRARMDDRAERLARQALPALLVALTIVDAGALAGLLGVAALGVAAYAGGFVWACRALVAPLRRRPPKEFCSASIGAAVVWFGIALVSTTALLLARPDARGLIAAYPNLVAVWVVGFALQLLLGALSYLLPSVLGGGPSVVRAGNAWFDRWAGFRLAVVNLGLPVWVAPVPSWVRVTVSIVVLAGLIAFLPLMMRGLRASVAERKRIALGGRPGDLVAGVGTPGPDRVSALTPVGVMAGVTALAVAVALGLGANAALAGGSARGAAIAPTGRTVNVAVQAVGMRFEPDRIEASAGDRVVIALANADPTNVHDLSIAGVDSGRLAPGASATLDLGVVGASTQGWCTIIGHRQMGMVLNLVVGGTAPTASGVTASGVGGMGGTAGMGHATAAASGAPTTAPLARTVDPVLPPVEAGTVHQVTLRVQEVPLEVAPGVWQKRWTFNGGPVGPVLHGRLGDTFEVTLINEGSMGHSIDFHAGTLAPDQPMRTIAPGQSLVYRFTANRAGIWMYHCSTMPMSAHISAGMHGAVVIDPPGLPAVDREYVLVQSEGYLSSGASSSTAATEVNADKVVAQTPDLVMFNGVANQYDQKPLAARVGERVRVWVLDAGPNRPESFHVVGGQFSTVFLEGAYQLRDGRDSFGGTGGGSQALGLQPAQGGFVELTFPEPGHYPVVSHVMSDAEKGAHGVFEVG